MADTGKTPTAAESFGRWTRSLAYYLPDKLGGMRRRGKAMVALTAPTKKKGGR